MLRFDKSAGRHDATTAVATGVSYQRQWLALITSQITQARNSLLPMLVAASFSSCIIADPPLSDSPGRTPPFLALNQAEPPTHKVVVLEDLNTNLLVNVPLRSEDNGEPLIAVFHLDYLLDDFGLIRRSIPLISPSTFDNTKRAVGFRLTEQNFFPLGLTGCHQLTLLVTHRDMFDTGTDRPYLGAAANDDTAQATWWLYIEPSNPSPGVDEELGRCPAPTEEQVE